MDPRVRHWDVNETKIVVRCWNSRIFGHTCSDDLVKAFNDGFNELNSTKLIQISMDGPISNLRFLSEIKKLKINNELASVINIGSCNLHVIHGTLKPALFWLEFAQNLHRILKESLVTLLGDICSRANEYFSSTGPLEYPLQFCGTR